jgi:hypothetical protein
VGEVFSGLCLLRLNLKIAAAMPATNGCIESAFDKDFSLAINSFVKFLSSNPRHSLLKRQIGRLRLALETSSPDLGLMQENK